MSGFEEQHATYAVRPVVEVGTRARVGAIGHEYEVAALIDDETALVHSPKYDEKVPYPIAEIEADIAGLTGMPRFQKLIGQVRSIGPAGPKYEVVSVEASGKATIWIIPNDDNDPYSVEEILLDPFAD